MLTTMIGAVSTMATANFRRSVTNAAACARCSRSSSRPASAWPSPGPLPSAASPRTSMTS